MRRADIENKPIKGRGSSTAPDGRFEPYRFAAEPDGWELAREPDPAPETTVRPDSARSVISRNDSPDIPFDQSVNPYRGCESGCLYCFARPTHSYLGLSPGLDFETRLFYKVDAAQRLREELGKPGYVCKPITLGINTDAYQPVEKRLRVTRSILEVLDECNHPVSILTKSALIRRDLDILGDMAKRGLVSAGVSLTTLDNALKRKLEPRTASPATRLKTIEALSQAGIPTSVMTAPVIPAITDAELEHLLEAAADAGARWAGYVLLRLPWEVKDLFREWLATHYPDRAAHVMSLIRQSRGGKDYDARFEYRRRGTGHFADLIAQRFSKGCKRYGLNQTVRPELDCSRFRAPRHEGQGELF